MIHSKINTVRLSQIVILICASILGISLTACSSRNDAAARNDAASVGRSSVASSMPAEQCEALGQIHQSAIQDPKDANYRIQDGDQLGVDFYLNAEFNDTVTVDPQGKIALRLVGLLPAAGLTPDQLAASINAAYQRELINPGAVVHVRNMPSRQIFVEGEVTKPGAFPLQPGMTVVQAVALAGGTTPDSATNSIVLIRYDACGQPQGSKVDLASAVKNPNAGDDVALMSQDVVVVPRSTIANIDLFVRHYIRDLLPVQPYFNMPI
jgi:protein involved in polysaccharide export with SLBB domain